ncbi:hypothetical protein Avbf_06256 [Armadillidium vulgare]|nr:hypothetical protein Avbf_06256 [Armadillidium vulgare]
MINLLAKFRIDVKDVIILPEVAKRAEQKTRDEFEEMISKFRVKEVDEEKKGLWITDEELSSRKEKTNRHLRIRELLLEHSKEASLIVISHLCVNERTCIFLSISILNLPRIASIFPVNISILGVLNDSPMEQTGQCPLYRHGNDMPFLLNVMTVTILMDGNVMIH